MRHVALSLALGLTLPAGAATYAQDAENGRRLSERWCAACHAIATPTAKNSRIISFAAIAEKPGLNAETIASFLMLPHSTMPNLPMKQQEARDIAGFIMKMKR
jgi:mono/diheme cytochrome c family protein